MYGNSLDGAIWALIVVGFVIGGAVVGICFWLIPWLWSLIKPFLHMVTA